MSGTPDKQVGDTGLEPVTSCVSCIDGRPGSDAVSAAETAISPRERRGESDAEAHIGRIRLAVDLHIQRPNWARESTPSGYLDPKQPWPADYRPPRGRQRTYFIHQPDLNRVKIGRAADIARRLATLRNGSAGPLYLAAAFETDCEEQMHWEFRHARYASEWFYACPALVLLIKDLNPDCPIVIDTSFDDAAARAKPEPPARKHFVRSARREELRLPRLPVFAICRARNEDLAAKRRAHKAAKRSKSLATEGRPQ